MDDNKNNPFDFDVSNAKQQIVKPKSTLKLPGRFEIDAYGNMGFRFAEMSHQGSLLILPSGISVWEIAEGDTLSVNLFDKIMQEADQIDILVLGMGEKMYMPPKEIRQLCKAANIVIEFMSTSNAVRTYNVLLDEERRVAAAFIAIN